MSRLSTEPRVIPVLRSTRPDSRTRYFEPLSTLVWLCSTILSFINSWSSSSLETLCCKSPCEESSGDCACPGELAEVEDNDDEYGTDVEDTCDDAGGGSYSAGVLLVLAASCSLVLFNSVRSCSALRSASCCAFRNSLICEFKISTCDCRRFTDATNAFMSAAISVDAGV